MYLVTKLSKRTKTISWFLIHVFVLQIIPFSAFAGKEVIALSKINYNPAIKNWESHNVALEIFKSYQFQIENDSSVNFPRTTDEIENSFKSNKTKIKVTSSSGGPGGGYSPASTGNFVDPFTGDFSYNIPLMDVEGYPLILNYNSNVSMNTEASWVGLGWNLDVGSVDREMRGIPDEFNGSQSVTRTYNKLDDETEGKKGGGYVATVFRKWPLKPKLQVTALWGKYTNTYLGKATTFDIGLQAAFSLPISKGYYIAPKFGLGYSSDTKGGVGFNRDFGLAVGREKPSGSSDISGSISFSQSTNSRQGVLGQSVSLGLSYVRTSSSDKTLSLGGATIGSSTHITYGTMTSVPRISMNSTSSSNVFMGDAYVGLKTAGIVAKVGGIYQKYETSGKVVLSSVKTLVEPAFGYLHSGKRANYPITNDYTFPIMDFNRGNDFEYSEEMKNLPFSIQTYDVFHMSSGGMSGTFRPGRTDMGTYYDGEATNKLNEGASLLSNNNVDAVNAGVLLSTGAAIIEIGYSSGIQKGNTVSKVWDTPMNFTSVSDGNNYDPSVYFKAVGETTPNNLAAYDLLGGKNPNRFNVYTSSESIVSDHAMDFTSATFTPSSLNGLGSKPVIATSFEPMIVSTLSASSHSSINSIAYYDKNQNYLTELRNYDFKAPNHISAVKVTSTDGTIFNYGIPSYSIKSVESTFSCSEDGIDRWYTPNEGLITYLPSDDSYNNQLGKSHHYDNTEVPAYPSSFLISSIVSSDYVDVENDGPTLDDVGTYHKFEHIRVYDNLDPYKWRFPISGYHNVPSNNPRALLNKGFLSLSSDDIGAYSYGEKEVWYPKTIEGKNVIAVFELMDRKDAYSVVNKDGFLDDQKPLKCLKKISLYNLTDYKQNPSTAVALQIVEFDYIYTLCLNAPGNKETYLQANPAQSGKLTLNRIWVYNGLSQEMAKNSVDFTYSTVNPSYNSLEIDRWGNYKQNNPAKPNDIFPYSVQDPTIANTNSSAWKLVKISSSAAGEMSINYEADTYGYVQNKRAMRHFDISGMINLYQYHTIMNASYWNASNGDLSNEFRKDNYNPDIHIIDPNFFKKYGKFEENFLANNIIVFKLEKPIETSSYTKSQANQLVKDQYFKDPTLDGDHYLKEIYFNVLAQVKPGYQEMIPCFATISTDYSGLFQTADADNNLVAIGVMPPLNSNSSYEYGYVSLEMIDVGKIEETKKKEKKDLDILLLHPIQRFAIDFIRKNLPDIVYGACTTCDGELSIDKKALFGKEMYKYIIDQGGYLRSITLSNSMIRLFDPNNSKFGGNARVASITINDNWSALTTESSLTNGTYTWSYKYPSRDKNLGVASYEPRQGMDENSFYVWDTYFDKKKKFPDELNFNVMPMAQQLYPSEVVGYEKVIVEMNQSNTPYKGHLEYEFITNKELKYITQVYPSLLDKGAAVHKKNLLTGNTVDLFGFTQGYSVVTNDFHGKIRKVALKDNKDKLISQSEYEYYELGEKVPMIDRKGHVNNENVAQEFDIHLDSRKINDENTSRTLGLTLAFAWSIPIRISLYPTFSNATREKGFYSMSLVKHMNYSAAVKKVKTTEVASLNEAENLLYDKYSGEVILASLNDEYNDKLYSLSYPSHWAYPGLREIQAVFPTGTAGTINSTNGVFTSSIDLTQFYSPGDFVSLTSGSTSSNGYILSFSSDGLSATILKPLGGIFNSFSGTATLALKQTNRNNRLSESMQSIVTKEVLTVPSNGDFVFPSNNGINSSGAVTYRDRNSIQCTNINGAINPFTTGAKGDLIVDGQFSWQSERKNELSLHKTRFDGAYLTYTPFYSYNTTDQKWHGLTPSTYQLWRKSGEVTEYDPYGSPIEGKDPLRIFSSILYVNTSKVHSLPVAQVVNGNLTDIVFDGFENYSYNLNPSPLNLKHFDFTDETANGHASINTTIRHSGLSSLQVPANQTAQVITPLTNLCPSDYVLDTDIPANLNVDPDKNCLCTPSFNPQPGKYICNAWVKQNGTGAAVKIDVVTGFAIPVTTTVTCENVGPVIEGWQRVEGTFIIPQTGATTVTVRLTNTSGQAVYFDDFRIHPFLAGMSTTVYHPNTLLPLATHDAYNYTTFYNYDENLQLVRVKVETIEGIKTVSETESGITTKP
jgi:hypothetical protein